MNNVIKKIIDAKCTSSWFLLYENFFVIISYNKKKLNIGNNKEIDKAKICESVFIILDNANILTRERAIFVNADLHPLGQCRFLGINSWNPASWRIKKR